MSIKPPKIRSFKYLKAGKDYESYQVIWNDRTGKRMRRQFTNRNFAELFSSEKYTELFNDGVSHRNVSTILSSTVVREAESCVTRLGDKYTLTQAVDYFLEHFHAPDFKISVSEASLSFRGDQEGVIRNRTLIQLKSTLGQFERFVDDCDLHEVTVDRVERFLKSLRGRDGASPASPKTWNNYRADLHLFFEWCSAKQRRWMASNPAAQTKRFKMEREHIEVLSAERAKALMDYIAEFKEGKYVPYFALALFAGIRPGGELEKLGDKPNLISLSNRVVRIDSKISKTGKARQVTIRPNLHDWLVRYPGRELFPVNCDRELKVIRKRFRLSHDVLRHTFCSAHVMAFGSFAEAAIESGNSEAVIRNHYLNAISKNDALAIWSVRPSTG
jgi:integrase